jgi:hypothetical protein
MARNKTEYVDNMDQDIVADDSGLYIMVRSDRYTVEQGTVSDPDAVTLDEKAFAQARMKVKPAGTDESSFWAQVKHCPGLSAGFMGDLKKLFEWLRDNHARGGGNLTPP